MTLLLLRLGGMSAPTMRGFHTAGDGDYGEEGRARSYVRRVAAP